MFQFRFLAVLLLAAGAAPAADAPPVGVGEAVERPIVRTVRVSGTVTSPRNAVLSPSVGGLVAAIAVDAGDRVAAGDSIVRLDAELARRHDEAAEARARYDAQQALLE